MSQSTRPTRHSYSSISTYEGCPAQYKYSYIDKLEYPSSPAMSRGTRLHKMAEDFITGKVGSIHHEICKIGPTLLTLQSQGAAAEATWLLDKNWAPTTDPSEARVKTIVDVHYRLAEVLHLSDYKSGQMYDSHRDQLELYGIVGLMVHPDAKRVETSAIYIDTGYEGMQGSIIRAMLPKLIDKWEGKIVAIETDDVFEPKPDLGRKCKWCPYSKAKGGPCEY